MFGPGLHRGRIFWKNSAGGNKNGNVMCFYLCKASHAYLYLENWTAYPLHPRTGKRLSVCVASRTKSTDIRVAPVYRDDPAGYNGTPVTRGPATMKAGRWNFCGPVRRRRRWTLKSQYLNRKSENGNNYLRKKGADRWMSLQIPMRNVLHSER